MRHSVGDRGEKERDFIRYKLYVRKGVGERERERESLRNERKGVLAK